MNMELEHFSNSTIPLDLIAVGTFFTFDPLIDLLGDATIYYLTQKMDISDISFVRYINTESFTEDACGSGIEVYRCWVTEKSKIKLVPFIA